MKAFHTQHPHKTVTVGTYRVASRQFIASNTQTYDNLGSTKNGCGVRLAVVTNHSTTRLMHGNQLHTAQLSQLHLTSLRHSQR